MHRFPIPTAHVVVVDSHPHDFALFDSLVDAGRLTLDFITQGRAALRQAGGSRADLWMINLDLADISGLDLFEMIARDLEQTPVFIVADRYRAEDEVHSLRLGATKYLCKPVAYSWLATLRLPAKRAREVATERPSPSAITGMGYKPLFFTPLDDP